MRKLLFLSLLLAPLAAFCNSKKMPVGKWREIKRIAADTTGKGPGTVVAFKDTIHLQFLATGEYVWQKQGGFIYKAAYTLNDKNLDIGIRDFTIIQRTPGRLVLKDETGTYEFVPDNIVQAGSTILPPEAKPKPVGSIDLMVGHWSVYKAVNNGKAPAQVDYTRKIKMIDVTGGSSDGKLGYIYASRDADNAPGWTIDSYSNNDQDLHCSGKDARTLHVVKCQDNDLILEEGGTTYSLKQFK